MAAPADPYDLIPDPVVRFAPDGTVVGANRAARELLGEDPRSRLGAAFREWLADALAGPVSECRQDLCVESEEGFAWYDARMVPAGEEIILVARDVTERRRREDELGHIINTVPDPIFVKDEQFRWTVLNDACCDFIGKPREQLLGRLDYDVFPKAEADVFRRMDTEVFEHHLDTPQLNEESFTDAAGVTHVISTKKRAFVNRDGTRTLVGVIRDITDLKGLQDEAERRADELSEANRRLMESERHKDEFVASVSHELRTPLTLMLAPIESMLAGDFGALTDRLRANAETMHNNAIRLLQMVNGLLDFSRLEAGQVEVSRVPVDVVALTRAAVRDFEPLTMRKGLQLELVTRTPRRVVELDRYLYERVVFNLLSNAVKFTPSGGRVTVELKVERGELELRVVDTGVGIPSMELPCIFERFRQVSDEEDRRFEGTGLGLAIVHDFAELLGGSTEVTSEVGVGTTFVVRLATPEVAGEVDAIERRESLVPRFATVDTELTPPPLVDAGLPRVLLVEDNPELATYVACLLEQTCMLKIARDGDSGFQLALDWQPDLVLSDVMMPGRDGFTLCRDLKANRRTRDIPVVLLTALTHRDALLKGWEAGADEYLFKPFHPRELATRVGSLLKNQQLRRLAEREALEKAMALTRAETMLEQLELFAYVASHHLQEPLRKVLLFGDLLESETELEGEPLEHLHRLEAAIQRMSRYIEDLRDFSAVTTRPNPFADLPLEELVRGVAEELDAVDSVEIAALPHIRGDAEQIRELFRRLLDNALRYRGEDAPRVRIRAAPVDDDFVEIEIEDNGRGFDPRYSDRIFRPFERLQAAGEADGTGMGLAICRMIALRHHGRIAAHGEEGRGVTIRVTLPTR